MQHETLSSPVRVPSDWPCVACGYNLRGLEVAGACPECATAVRLSMSDPFLRYSAPAHLALLHRGSIMVELSILFMVVGVALTILFALLVTWGGKRVLNVSVPPGALDMVGGGLWFAVSVVALWGWWLISTPDPALSPGAPGWRSRRILRAGVAVQLAAALLSFAFDAVIAILAPSAVSAVAVSVISGTIGTASAIAWAVSYFAAMTYVGHLAGRIPDASLGSHARYMRKLGWVVVGGWGGLLVLMLLAAISGQATAYLGTIVGILACFGLPLLGITSFGALIAYIVLIDRLRFLLKRERAASEMERAAAAGGPAPAATPG